MTFSRFKRALLALSPKAKFHLNVSPPNRCQVKFPLFKVFFRLFVSWISCVFLLFAACTCTLFHLFPLCPPPSLSLSFSEHLCLLRLTLYRRVSLSSPCDTHPFRYPAISRPSLIPPPLFFFPLCSFSLWLWNPSPLPSVPLLLLILSFPLSLFCLKVSLISPSFLPRFCLCL